MKSLEERQKQRAETRARRESDREGVTEQGQPVDYTSMTKAQLTKLLKDRDYDVTGKETQKELAETLKQDDLDRQAADGAGNDQ